jgi:hypothetical protein
MPASVGSSFDAFVKAHLHEALFGKGADPQFELQALFESQVEKPNWDQAFKFGGRCFQHYVATGAYDELLTWMKQSTTDPQFEFDAQGVVEGIPLFGKPDCCFTLPDDLQVVLDWKVKGYCSKWSASPSKHYALCRDGLDWPKPSRSHGTSHKNYKPIKFHGVEIHGGGLEDGNAAWATQLTIYSWLMGAAPGDENVIVGIDELVSKSRLKDGLPPLLRIAQHRARISKSFQMEVLAGLKALWNSIQDGWIRRDLSQDESAGWFETCQQAAIGLASDGSPEDEYYNQVARPAYRG